MVVVVMVVVVMVVMVWWRQLSSLLTLAPVHGQKFHFSMRASSSKSSSPSLADDGDVVVATEEAGEEEDSYGDGVNDGGGSCGGVLRALLTGIGNCLTSRSSISLELAILLRAGVAQMYILPVSDRRIMSPSAPVSLRSCENAPKMLFFRFENDARRCFTSSM
jgi:hypothetical protein